MNRHHRTVSYALACALALATAVAPASAADKPDPDAADLSTVERLEALLERIKIEQGAMKTLEAQFVQKKESQLLLEPEEATGRISYRAPDQVLWEFTAPESTVVAIDGDSMLTWYRDLGTAERVEVGKQSSRVFDMLGATNSLATLQRYFDVTIAFPKDDTTPYRLELSPRFSRVAKRIQGMTLWLDRELYFPTRLVYVEPDGDKTEFVFSDVEVNGDVPASRFDIELPADVEMTNLDLGG